MGQGSGKTGLADDGTFTVHAGDYTALVELVPDPQTDAVSVCNIQIRHDAADIREVSEVGVYVVARRATLSARTRPNSSFSFRLTTS